MIKSGMQDISAKNNYLTVVLDDGDEVIHSIESAFKEQDIKKAILISAEGKLRDSRIAISRAGTLRQRIYAEALNIKQVSGEFNKVSKDYFGDVNISIEKDLIHVVNGVLLKGISDGEVIFKFKIIKNIGYGINEGTRSQSKNRNLVKEKILAETNKKPMPFIIA